MQKTYKMQQQFHSKNRVFILITIPILVATQLYNLNHSHFNQTPFMSDETTLLIFVQSVHITESI